MKKIIILLMTVFTLSIFAADDLVIDKEVRGINLEQLEKYDSKNTIDLSSEQIIIPDKATNTGVYSESTEVIQLNKSDDDFNDSILSKEKKSPWKFILGIIVLVAVGASI